MTKKTNKITRWTEEERMAIVNRAIELRRFHMPDGVLELFRESQKVLPPERQRRVRTAAEIPWFMEMANKVLAQQRKEACRGDQAPEIVKEMFDAMHQQHGDILAEIRDLRKAVERKCGL